MIVKELVVFKLNDFSSSADIYKRRPPLFVFRAAVISYYWPVSQSSLFELQCRDERKSPSSSSSSSVAAAIGMVVQTWWTEDVHETNMNGLEIHWQEEW